MLPGGHLGRTPFHLWCGLISSEPTAPRQFCAARGKIQPGRGSNGDVKERYDSVSAGNSPRAAAERLLDAILIDSIAVAAAAVAADPTTERVDALLREVGRARGLRLSPDDPRRRLSHSMQLRRAIARGFRAEELRTIIQRCGGVPLGSIAPLAAALALCSRARKQPLLQTTNVSSIPPLGR